MKYLVKFCLMLSALGLLLMPLARAAGFDCEKVSQPIELVLCGDGTLSEEDETLNDAYGFLFAECQKVAERADLRATQRRWLEKIRNDFGAGGPAAKGRLKAAYRARNEALGKLLAECNPAHGSAYATVTKVHDTPNNIDVLFVQTNPPQAGWRINRVLFDDYDGRPPSYIGGLKDFFANHGPANEDSGFSNVELVLNKGNLLEMSVTGLYYEEGFPRAYPSGGTRLFDIRTGREVQFKELFTNQNDPALNQYLREKLLSVAKARLAAISQADAQAHAGQYKGCLETWAKDEVYMYSELQADGSIKLSHVICSLLLPSRQMNNASKGAGLDDLNLAVTPSEIRPYLSAYGKSLLLGEGDVLAPAR